jgi:hypothetical protein
MDVRVPSPAEIQKRLELLHEEQRQLRRLLRLARTAVRAEEARRERHLLEGTRTPAEEHR